VEPQGKATSGGKRKFNQKNSGTLISCLLKIYTSSFKLIAPMNDKPKDFSRRKFIRNGSIAAAGITIVPRHVLGRGYVAPSDKLNIAGIGAGGKGQSDIANFFKSGNANIVALCDVDDRASAKTRADFPKPRITKISGKCLIRKKTILMRFPFPFPIMHMQFRP
jgi:hypothetical protein